MAEIFGQLQSVGQLHDAEQRELAERLCRQILKAEPAHGPALDLLGILAVQQAKNREAIDLFTHAIRTDDKVAAYHVHLGEALHLVGQIEEAQACYRQALDLDPAMPHPYLRLAEISLGCGDFEGAQLLATRAVELKPDLLDAYQTLGVALQSEGKTSEAIDCWRRALELQPDNLRLISSLGAACTSQERFEEAAEYFRRARIVLQCNPVLQPQGFIRTELSMWLEEMLLQPSHGRLAASLNEISEIFAANELPSEEQITRLKVQWAIERPNDEQGRSAFLELFHASPNDAELANAQNILTAAERQSAADGVALRATTRVKRLSMRDDAPESKPEVEEVVFEDHQGWVYPVFFATNRRLTEPLQSSTDFSSESSTEIHYGRCNVWIPLAHNFGESGNPWWWRWPRLKFKDDHLYIETVEILPKTEFWSQLNSEMKQFEPLEPQGLVFLHGYNVSFTEAAIRAAQIGFDLKVKGATAFFSWPSQGALKGYTADAASIEASEEAIAKFLADFARNSGAKVVHVLAHSMGNIGLLRGLQRLDANPDLMAGARLGQVMLAAPDVDQRLFLNLAELYVKMASRTTLYASKRDLALAASSWLHAYPRAGYYHPVTVSSGLDTVTVPNFNVDLLGHGYFAGAEALLYDMGELMQHGTPPGNRQRVHPDGQHWTLRG